MLPILISADMLQDIIEKERKEKYLLIDLRDKDEYEKYHLDGAVNMDYGSLMKTKYFGNELTYDKKLILYCDKGSRSIYAARKLRTMNYDAASLSGGLDNYTRQYKKFTFS